MKRYCGIHNYEAEGEESCPACIPDAMNLDAIKKHYEAATEALSGLCHGEKFVMSIPVRPNTDADFVIDAALSDIPALVAELEEGDYWQERARQSFSTGTCPTCFCTDEGPHKKGCYIEELAARIAELEGALCREREYRRRYYTNDMPEGTKT